MNCLVSYWYLIRNADDEHVDKEKKIIEHEYKIISNEGLKLSLKRESNSHAESTKRKLRKKN